VSRVRASVFNRAASPRLTLPIGADAKELVAGRGGGPSGLPGANGL